MHFIFPLVISLANAGTYTDAPGFLQGDVGMRTMYRQQFDSLIEADQSVANRAFNQFETSLELTLGVWDFISIDLNIPYGIQSLSFNDASKMVFSPMDSTGTYISDDSTSLEGITRSGRGFDGTVLGVNFYPFHSKIFSERGDRGS